MKEETENVSANQRSRQPLLAMNHFKKIQHIFKTTRGTSLVSLVNVHVVVLKMLNMPKFYDIKTEGQMEARPFIDQKISLKPLSLVN